MVVNMEIGMITRLWAQPFCDLWRCRHANDARRESGSAFWGFSSS